MTIRGKDLDIRAKRTSTLLKNLHNINIIVVISITTFNIIITMFIIITIIVININISYSSSINIKRLDGNSTAASKDQSI